ncbi:hypothetical protein BDA96_08G066400 [Sorghum bicolor]|uniref:Uncharacterized protein n=1 Tax=Sorghum bicolor TaxID=4558 RepID=A0A921U776_SORBI|nr:hypothetical protein BDA96_08G066400 [Sorghum bicolor]
MRCDCDATPQAVFGVQSIKENDRELMAALYLQVSIISQALIFVTRSRSWSFVERPGFLLLFAAQAAGGDVHRGVRQLGLLPHAGDRLGVGRRHLDLQHRHLHPARRAQVHDPRRAQRQGRGQQQRPEQVIRVVVLVSRGDGVHEQGLRQEGEREAQGAVEQRTHSTGLNQLATSSDVPPPPSSPSRPAKVARLVELQTLKRRVESVAKLAEGDRRRYLSVELHRVTDGVQRWTEGGSPVFFVRFLRCTYVVFLGGERAFSEI